MPTSTPTKVCSSCLTERPFSEFHRRKKGGNRRSPKCRQCHAASVANWRARRKEKAIRGFLSDVRRCRSDQQVLNLVHLFMRRYGGPVGFAKSLDEVFRKLEEDGEHLASLLKGYESLMRLLAIGAVLESRPAFDERTLRDAYRQQRGATAT